MTKSELIDIVQERAASQNIELTKKDVRTLLDIVFDAVADSVEDDERFSYPNFGTFEIRHRKAREGRNPQTGEPIQLPASNTVGFKPSPSLKERLN